MAWKETTVACVLLALGLACIVPTVSAGNATSYSCSYHDEYPLRKYDCTGSGTSGSYDCTVHWADDDNNNDWEDTNSRVYTSSCSSATWEADCYESTPGTYECSGSGYRDGEYCSTFTWTDDDANPDPDSGATEKDKSCAAPTDVVAFVRKVIDGKIT